MRTVYEAAGGDEGLVRLARAWHARVMAWLDQSPERDCTTLMAATPRRASVGVAGRRSALQRRHASGTVSQPRLTHAQPAA